MDQNGRARGQSQWSSVCLQAHGPCRRSLSLEVVQEIFGHSSSVGGVQDMAAFGSKLSATMQAGRWKTATKMSRHTEKLMATHGGNAKLAALQNRL